MQPIPRNLFSNSVLNSKTISTAFYYPTIFLYYILLLFYGFTAYSQSGTFTNPIRDGADPWVFQKEEMYYYCATAGNGIFVSKSEKLTEEGEKKKVWSTPEEG